MDDSTSGPAGELIHQHVADDLILARHDRRETLPPSQRFPGFSAADARAVAELHDRVQLLAGERHGGIKLGLTYEPVWAKLGVAEPFVAPIYASGVRADGAVSIAALRAPRLEIEVVLWLSAPLLPGADEKAVRAAVASAALGYEIVDSHYPGWAATPADLVADFGCHAGLRTADRLELSTQTFDIDALAGLEVGLRREGDVTITGCGSKVLGSPLAAVVRAMRSAGARPLDAGHLISTGSLTGRSHPIAAGEVWTTEVVNGPKLPPFRLEVR